MDARRPIGATMPLYSFEGASPTVHPTAWIAPTATLVGNVTVEAEASVWYGVVLRGDFGPVVVGRRANVQDNSVIHSGPEGTVVGPGATIGHLCVVHSATIGEDALIGNGATVQDGAQVGARALVGAGSLVPPNAVIPPGVLAMGVPARERGPLTATAAVWVDANPSIYAELARRHAAGTAEVGGAP
jgi:carbonic anhydrase/acetyltransferase-like protein (isoleucine patch superfamily)